MIITYLGAALVKIQVGDLVAAFNPYGKGEDARAPRFGADIVLVSSHEPVASAIENATFGNKTPFVIDGPGEYEVGGVYIRGAIGEVKETKKARVVNTVYQVLLEGVSVGHMGLQKTPDLSGEARELLEEVDILFIPVGGGDVLSGKEAHKLATSLLPKIVIPVFTDHSKDAGTLFAREFGKEHEKPLEKLVVKKKDLEGKEGDVMLLARI